MVTLEPGHEEYQFSLPEHARASDPGTDYPVSFGLPPQLRTCIVHALLRTQFEQVGLQIFLSALVFYIAKSAGQRGWTLKHGGSF